MRRPISFALSLALLSGCASSSSSTSTGTGTSAATTARQAPRTMGGADVGSITIATSSTADVTHLANSVDAVWRIMPSVFDSVGIAVTTIDQQNKQIGNPGYKIRSRLGKVTLSRYLDCGNTQIGPNADSYDVFLSVLTTVSAEGASGTKLSTIVDAQAKPITYNQAYSRCSSKGGIEMRIAELVKARLAK